MVALEETGIQGKGNQKLFEYLDKTYVVAELERERSGGMWSWQRGTQPPDAGAAGEKFRVLGQAPQAAPNISP